MVPILLGATLILVPISALGAVGILGALEARAILSTGTYVASNIINNNFVKKKLVKGSEELT